MQTRKAYQLPLILNLSSSINLALSSFPTSWFALSSIFLLLNSIAKIDYFIDDDEVTAVLHCILLSWAATFIFEDSPNETIIEIGIARMISNYISITITLQQFNITRCFNNSPLFRHPLMGFMKYNHSISHQLQLPCSGYAKTCNGFG